MNASSLKERSEDNSSGKLDLNDLISHLQGCTDGMVVGAGLARLGPGHLAAIYQGAEAQANDCLRGIAAILQVLTLVARYLDQQVPVHVVQDISAHLRAQTQALECWNTLADHAAYLLRTPLVARGLAEHGARPVA